MNQGFNKNLIILFLTPIFFIITGIALLCAGSLDNMVAGICMLALATWLSLFFMLAFKWVPSKWIGPTLELKENELIYRKGINCVQSITFDKVEEIGIFNDGIKGEYVNLLLKDGTLIVAQVEEGLKLVRKVRKNIQVSVQSKKIEKLEEECLKNAKKSSVLIGGLILVGIVLVVSLPVAIIATEGKEVDYFNERDWLFFSVFMSIFTLCLFGLLAFIPPVFRLAGETRERIWSWRRGILFEDTLELLDVQEVYISIDLGARFSCKKEIVSDAEKLIVSIEVYEFKKRRPQKRTTLFYEKEAETIWDKVVKDQDVYRITELINPQIFEL